MAMEDYPDSRPPPAAAPAEQEAALEVSISDGETLVVGGRALTSQDSPELLRQALTNYEYIKSTLCQQMEANRQAHPDRVVSLPALGVTRLATAAGNRPFKVIEEPAYWSNKTGGVYRQMEDIKPKYHEFWRAVAQSGLVPEVVHKKTWEQSDVWLYARLPDLVLAPKRFDPDRQVYDYEAVAAGMNVGVAQLRLVPSKGDDMPEGFEGHVYYEMEDHYRGQGYASRTLAELIKAAFGHQVDNLVATANADNLASIRVIEKNGGQLVAKGTTAAGTEVLKFVIPSSVKNT